MGLLHGNPTVISLGTSVSITPGGPVDAFADYYRRETERWVRVIRSVGIKGD